MRCTLPAGHTLNCFASLGSDIHRIVMDCNEHEMRALDNNGFEIFTEWILFLDHVIWACHTITYAINVCRLNQNKVRKLSRVLERPFSQRIALEK